MSPKEITTATVTISGHTAEIKACYGGFLRRVDGVWVEVVAHAERRTRYYIGMFQPGFNSRANNRDGYKSDTAAAAASNRYASR